MSQSFSRSLVSFVAGISSLTRETLERFARAIELRLVAVEAQRTDIEAAISSLQQVGLTRINEVLIPLIDTVMTIQERGHMLARSSTSANIAEGNTVTVFIQDEDERAMFVPSPSVAFTRELNTTDYAIVRVVGYDKVTGELIGLVDATYGNAGPHADWIIGALPGATTSALQSAAIALAARNLAKDWAYKGDGLDVDGVGTRSAKHYANSALASASAAGGSASTASGAALTSTGARDTTVAAKDVAVAKAAEAAASAAAALLAVAGGVTSINGLTGVVTGFLQSTHIGSTVQAYDADLAAIANLSNADNNFIVGNGTTWVVESGATARASLGLGTSATLNISTDGTLSGNSDTAIPTQKAIKTYADGLIAANDAMVFKGIIDCSANPNYPAADRGWTYRVSVAGKIGGASGVNVEAGDILLCLTDGTAAGTQAAVGTNWGAIQLNIDGALTTANIGGSVQAYDADLTAIAGQTYAANDMVYWTASGVVAKQSTTSFGRSLLNIANAATLRTTADVYAKSEVDSLLAPIAPDYELITAGTASSVANVSLTSIFSSAYDNYIVEIYSLYGVSNSEIYLTLSENGGSSYFASAYSYTSIKSLNSSVAAVSPFTFAFGLGTVGTAAASRGMLRLRISRDTAKTFIVSEGYDANLSAAYRVAGMIGHTSKVNSLRLALDNGNIAFIGYRVYGIKNT